MRVVLLILALSFGGFVHALKGETHFSRRRLPILYESKRQQRNSDCKSNADCREGRFCDFHFGESGLCRACHSWTPPDCFDPAWILTEPGRESCLSCFSSCTTEEEECTSGTFCTLGACMSCDSFRDPISCLQPSNNLLLLSADRKSCATKCFGECSDQQACGNDSFCSLQFGETGACINCSYVWDPHMCLDLDIPDAGRDSCASTCFEECSDTISCPENEFCTYQVNSSTSGACMQCPFRPQNCDFPSSASLDIELPMAGQDSCVSTCFPQCSKQEPCPTYQFCSFQLGDSGACLACSPWDPLACMDADLPKLGSESCKSTCLQECSDDGSCPDEKFCAYQSDLGTNGACMKCAKDPVRCDSAAPASLDIVLPMAGQDNCVSTCFPQCSEQDPCLPGSFCSFQLGDSGACISCTNIDTPFDCMDFPSSSHATCVSECFEECSVDKPCHDDAFCTWQLGTSGACISCEWSQRSREWKRVNNDPLDCMELSFGRDSCASTCYGECSEERPCPTGSFCTFQFGSLSGACMRCPESNPITCSKLTTPGTDDFKIPDAGEASCASACFGMSECSSSKPCKDEGTFCTLQSTISSGYCMQCDRFQDPLSCFDWRNAKESGQKNCASTCFTECSYNNSCPNGSFCNFDQGDTGYCSFCHWFSEISGCYERQTLSIHGEASCASTCFQPCSLENNSCGVDSFCTFEEDGYCKYCSGIDSLMDCTKDIGNLDGQDDCTNSCFEDCSADIPCTDGHFCTFQFGSSGSCMICNEVSSPLDCSDNQFIPSGQEDCGRSCFMTCSDDVPCTDGYFCTFQFGSEGLCMGCDHRYIDTPLDCEDTRLDLILSGQESCANSCFGSCTNDAPCNQGAFCSYQFGTTGACMDCNNDEIRNPVNCSNGNLNLLRSGQDDCTASCFEPCSIDVECPAGSFCTHQSEDEVGYCMDCAQLNGNPFRCQSLLEFGQANCKRSCFPECSSDVLCQEGYFCKFEFESNGYCTSCNSLYGDPYECLDLNKFATDTAGEICLSSCFHECDNDDDCGYDISTNTHWECSESTGFCENIPPSTDVGSESPDYCRFCPNLKPAFTKQIVAPKDEGTETLSDANSSQVVSPNGESWCPDFCPQNDMIYPDRNISKFKASCLDVLFLSIDDPSGRDCRLAKNSDYICGCTGNGYVGADSQTKMTLLVWLPRCMALISFASSMTIIVDILRNEGKRQKTFGQLILALSIFDLMGSMSYAFTTLPIPEEEYVYGSKGNGGTCKLQGFFIQMGMIAAYLNAALSVHYILMLKYGWSEERISKLRPLLLGIPLSIGLVFAFAGIPFYDNVFLWCNNASASVWPDIPMAVAIAFVSIIMAVICWHVYKEERVSMKWRISTRRQNTSLTTKVFWQSIYFLLAFYLVWPPYLALQYTWVSGNGYNRYGFILFAGMLVPLQGFWNLIVYMRPRIKRQNIQPVQWFLHIASLTRLVSSVVSRSIRQTLSASNDEGEQIVLTGNDSSSFIPVGGEGNGEPDTFEEEESNVEGNVVSSVKMHCSVFCSSDEMEENKSSSHDETQ